MRVMHRRGRVQYRYDSLANQEIKTTREYLSNAGERGKIKIDRATYFP